MQRHSRLLAEHLARTPGIRLTVVHPHTEKVFGPDLGITEVPIADIDPQRFYLRELYRYSGRVAQALDRERPDVILSQGFSVWQGAARFRDRLVVHPHGLEMFQGLSFRDKAIGWPFRIILRWILRRSRVCISLGGRLTPILKHLTNGSGAVVAVIPNAVEPPAVPPAYPMEATPLRVLFVGRFAFNKGLDLLLHVARRLEGAGRSADVLFKLAGDGPLMASIRDQGVPANVQLLGKVNDEQLFEAYRWCHALVLPTRFEGMPTVVLEAMAQGRVALVSDVGASAELVDPDNGTLLPKGDAEALYKALVDLAAAPSEERAKMGAAGHERVLARFTWEVCTDQFVALFRQVAGR